MPKRLGKLSYCPFANLCARFARQSFEAKSLQVGVSFGQPPHRRQVSSELYVQTVWRQAVTWVRIPAGAYTSNSKSHPKNGGFESGAYTSNSKSHPGGA